MYSKSTNEILVKLLTCDMSLCEESLNPLERKQSVVSRIIDKVGPEWSEFDNLNAAHVLTKLSESITMYDIIVNDKIINDLIINLDSAVRLDP
jgi:hypothetical protein